MSLNNYFKCNHQMPLHVKGLNLFSINGRIYEGSVYFHIISVLQCVLCAYKLLFLLDSQTAITYHSVFFCFLRFSVFRVSKLRLLSYFKLPIFVLYYSIFVFINCIYSTAKFLMLYIRLLCANKNVLLTYLLRQTIRLTGNY